MKFICRQLKTATPVLAIFLLANSSLAQAAAPAAPDAGTILQQVQPVEPPTPSSGSTGLKIEREGPAKSAPSAPFPVTAIQITGNTQFATSALHTLVMDAEGQSLTLDQLNKLASRITDYYHDQGFPLARAIIPPQTIHEGRVQIQVIEARYGTINLDNISRVNDTLLAATLAPVQSGQPISQSVLDRSLLLLSDIPGVVPDATLRPGVAVGTSDLVVKVASSSAVTGSISLDNYGNAYTGRAHLGGTVNLINPLHQGDMLSAYALTSGSDMNYGRVSYESMVSGQGTRLGGSYSALHYFLGDTFSLLNGHGTAQVASLWIKHPLVRSITANLYGQLQYDHLDLRDHIDVSHIKTDRHLDNWTATLSGDRRDTILSGGINSWNVGWMAGQVTFDNASAQQSDAGTANTQGNFNKWNVNLVRLQYLSRNNTLYLAFSGQWADKNLDSSQKMIAGGPYTVRAYDMDVVSGDEGHLATAEIRHNLGLIWGGRYQVVGFLDTEHVKVNKDVWASGTNQATLNGIGVGLDGQWPGQWTGRAYIAAPNGTKPNLVPNPASVRGWVEIGKAF